MSNKLAQKIGRSIFASHAQALEPRNPLYETATDPHTGKQKRKRRGLPQGLSKKEQAILKKVRKRAHCLDKGFNICGFRFGWTAVIGLIPVVGDVADATLSYILVIKPARECDLPTLLVQRMLLNQALSTSIGMVPVVGDILMAVWKVNSRNAALLEDFLIVRAQQAVPDAPGSEAPGVAPVPAKETTKLVASSSKPAYVDGITGEHEPVPGASETLLADDRQPAVATATEQNKKTKRGWFGTKKTEK